MAKILIIDDEEKVRLALKKMLTHAGHEVVLAEDGNQGLKCCRQQTVDLVITDIVMPDKEGLGTIRDLRRDFPALKIIAMSGGGAGSAQDYLKVAKHFGAQMAFEKPVEFRTLLAAIQHLLTSGSK